MTASSNMRSGHYNNKMGSSDESSKVAKILLLLFLNELVNPLGLELFRIVKQSTYY